MGRVILFFLKILSWLIYLLPNRVRLVVGSGLGLLLRAAGFRAKVIRQNLAYAFPNSPEKQAEIFKKAYSHLGNLFIELTFLFGPLARFAKYHATLEGAEHLLAAIAEGKGTMFLSSHVGNWEIMAAGGGMHIPELDLMLVTKHLKPEWIHQAVQSGRATARVRATYEPQTMRDVLAHLKKQSTVGFVLDQYAGPPVGTRVPVFGIPVGTPSAVAALAKRTGARVLPVVSFREPSGRHRIQIRPAIDWQEAPGRDPQYELGLNTAYYASILEKDIYEHPEQWLWTHRRFKGDLSPLREGEWSEGRARR